MTLPYTPEVHTDLDGSRYYTHPATGEQLMSVTTILGATEARQHYLAPWSARIAAEFAVDNLDAINEILRVEGREAAVALVKDRARQIRERKADAGKYVHAVAEALTLWAASPDGTGQDIVLPTLPEHLQGVDYDDQPLDEVVDWMITGFTNFISAFDPEPEAAEMKVYNPVLRIAGTLDLIIRLRGVALAPSGEMVAAPGNTLTLCVDIKTGREPGRTAQEQMAAYRRMHECLLPMGELADMPHTDAGAILHLRPEHQDGYRLMPISRADDARAWNRFRRAAELEQGRTEAPRKPGMVAYPARPDGTMPPRRLADLDHEGYGRALGPLLSAGLVDVLDLAGMTADDLLAIKGVGKKTAGTVRRLLADHGLTLADETPADGKAA